MYTLIWVRTLVNSPFGIKTRGESYDHFKYIKTLFGRPDPKVSGDKKNLCLGIKGIELMIYKL